jgi:hypothetical protein
VDFTIGRRSDRGGWEEVEAITASSPAAAFSQWVDNQGGVKAGQYGVRESDVDNWESLFRVDDDGLHPVDAF